MPMTAMKTKVEGASGAARPSNVNGLKVGDAVRLPGIDAIFQVVSLSDRNSVTLRAPSGQTVWAGWRVLQRVKKHV